MQFLDMRQSPAMSTAGCGPRGRPQAANFEGVRDSLGIANASPTIPSKELQLIDVGKRRWKIVIDRLRSQRSSEAKFAGLPYELARRLSRRFILTPKGQSLSMTKIASRKIAPAVHKIDSNSSIGNKESAHRITLSVWMREHKDTFII